MIIRRLKRSEIPEIVKLHKYSIFSIWKKVCKKYSLKEVSNYLKKNYNKEKIYVIEKNGKIIACGSILIYRRFKEAHIGMILVNKKQQGQGYGKMIMEFLEDYAKKNKCNHILLDVLIKNPAVRFYKHFNYKEFKLLMRKDLVKI